jgi:uncharacterized Zn-binding protein involved in type VI secretion
MLPAARLGDMTAHGTPLQGTGSPDVMVEGMPAWRGSDLHTCAIVGPGGQLHGTGSVATGSPTVLINGQLATRVGDLIAETGPPNTIVTGAPTVLVGGGRANREPDEASTETDTGASTGDVQVRGPDGEPVCVGAVEGERPVEEFYGLGEEGDRSATLPDGTTVANATVTFVYHDRSSGERSLVVVNGAPSESEDGGTAAMQFEGVEGASWQVQGDRPGSDAYETADGELGATESVVWAWGSEESDGGAIGPLGDDGALVVTHQASGVVGQMAGSRGGLERWLFLDGERPDEPVELASFDGEDADVAVELSLDGC